MRELNRISKLYRKWLRSTAGNMTIVASLSALPMFVIAGGAIDYITLTRESTAFQGAVDSAASAVAASDKASVSGLSGSALTQRMAELKTLSNNYIARNFKSRSGRTATYSLNLSIDGKAVRLTATHKIHTPWLSAFGVEGPNVTFTSEIKKAARPVELVLVMDTTGSMGTTYMTEAKAAARKLLTKVYGGSATDEPESEFIRVALVPFSGAVRLNTSGYDYSSSWIDTTGAATVSKLNFSNTSPVWHNYLAWTKLSNRPWNGCVEARWGSYSTDDTAPSSGDTLFTPYFAPDEPTFSGSTNSPYNLVNSYISSSGTPNETTSITSTNYTTTGSSTQSCSSFSSSSTSTTNLMCRQNNHNKYVNKSITAESSSDYGPWFNCAKSSVVGLTYDRSLVEAGINAMTSSGSTVIPEGLAWGWRVLSPTEPFTKVKGSANNANDTIAPYNSARWQKIMVLMTDGENDVLSNGNQVSDLNGSWYSAYGRGKATNYNRFGTTTASQYNSKLDAQTTTLCNNIKAQNITLYTVAFRVNSTSIQNRLKGCATTEAHYSYAADGVALAAVFDHIGENVANTNIYYSK